MITAEQFSEILSSSTDAKRLVKYVDDCIERAAHMGRHGEIVVGVYGWSGEAIAEAVNVYQAGGWSVEYVIGYLGNQHSNVLVLRLA